MLTAIPQLSPPAGAQLTPAESGGLQIESSVCPLFTLSFEIAVDQHAPKVRPEHNLASPRDVSGRNKIRRPIPRAAGIHSLHLVIAASCGSSCPARRRHARRMFYAHFSSHGAGFASFLLLKNLATGLLLASTVLADYPLAKVSPAAGSLRSLCSPSSARRRPQVRVSARKPASSCLRLCQLTGGSDLRYPHRRAFHGHPALWFWDGLREAGRGRRRADGAECGMARRRRPRTAQPGDGSSRRPSQKQYHPRGDLWVPVVFPHGASRAEAYFHWARGAVAWLPPPCGGAPRWMPPRLRLSPAAWDGRCGSWRVSTSPNFSSTRCGPPTWTSSTG